jgi:hypothetical protein
MVRAGRIAGGGADAAILLADQRLVGQLLARGIAPQITADMGVQRFRKGFGKAVGQSLQENVAVIVMVRLETFQMRLDPMDAHGETAQPVVRRVDEVGQAEIGAAPALDELLAQHGQAGAVVEQDVIAFTMRGPESADAARGQPLFLDDPRQHFLRIGKRLRARSPTISSSRIAG